MKTVSEAKISVFYDGLCYLCSAEIEHYRRLDSQNKFHFIDISGEFRAEEYQLDAEQVKKVLHVISPEGQIFTGLDSFIYIWRNLDKFHFLARAASFAPVHFLMRWGYSIFAFLRPWLPRRKCANSCGWEKI